MRATLIRRRRPQQQHASLVLRAADAKRLQLENQWVSLLDARVPVLICCSRLYYRCCEGCTSKILEEASLNHRIQCPPTKQRPPHPGDNFLPSLAKCAARNGWITLCARFCFGSYVLIFVVNHPRASLTGIRNFFLPEEGGIFDIAGNLQPHANPRLQPTSPLARPPNHQLRPTPTACRHTCQCRTALGASGLWG
jgi:hypothetical protein